MSPGEDEEYDFPNAPLTLLLPHRERKTLGKSDSSGTKHGHASKYSLVWEVVGEVAGELVLKAKDYRSNMNLHR